MDDNTVPSQPQPASVIGSIAKEQAPIDTTVSKFIQPSEKEPTLDKDLEQAGVEKVSESPQLSSAQKDAGIEYAKETTPVSTNPSGTSLPLTEEEALRIIKTTDSSESRHWFAVLIEKIYQQIRSLHKSITEVKTKSI